MVRRFRMLWGIGQCTAAMALAPSTSTSTSAGSQAGNVSSPEAVCSVSESLAHGLVTRMTGGAAQTRQRLAERVPLPSLTSKRAAQYRAACTYVLNAIPRDLLVLSTSNGDQSGKDKNAWRLFFHWGCLTALEVLSGSQSVADDQREQLVLMVSGVYARHRSISSRSIALVSRHALMRLFYRLKTTDESPVLDELADFAVALSCFKDVTDRMSWDCELLVPSRSGAFVLVRDRTGSADVAVRTWMSHDRMVDNRWRQAAVALAREENGLVVNHTGGFPVMSRRRLAAATGGKPFANAVVLNRVCDAAFGTASRLPADWRFHEPQDIPAPGDGAER